MGLTDVWLEDFLFLIMKAQVGDDDISTTSPHSSLQGTCLLSAYLLMGLPFYGTLLSA